MITALQKICSVLGMTMLLFSSVLNGHVIPPDSHPSHPIPLPSAPEIIFTLFATDMSGCDATSACDLFVRLHCASGGDDWTVCGETSKIQDDNYPIWTEVFTFPHFPGTNQRWKFELIDVDVTSDDVIANIEVNVDQYANKTGNLLQIPVPDNKGTFWMHRQR